MKALIAFWCVLAGGCAFGAEVKSRPPPGGYACAELPTGVAGGFRHVSSTLAARIGEARHRGVDMIARDGDAEQSIAGRLSYTSADKALEDEAVDVYTCQPNGWDLVSTTRTDDNGRFAVELAGDARLPVGTHELFARVRGDNTGIRFYGFVIPADQQVVVSDVDGTLTDSETACVGEIVLGRNPGAQPGAAQALADTGELVVYLTTRGDQYTELTRQWLEDHAFPRGALRLAPSTLTLPGAAQRAAKTRMLASLGVPVSAAIGNRESDVRAYQSQGLPASRIFIKLPEFSGELAADLTAHQATGFDDFGSLSTQL